MKSVRHLSKTSYRLITSSTQGESQQRLTNATKTVLTKKSVLSNSSLPSTNDCEYFGVKSPIAYDQRSKWYSETLSRLRNGSEFQSTEEEWALLLLPSLTLAVGRPDELAQILDVWWRKAKPLIGKIPVKITSLLIHLGKLSAQYPVVEKLGGWASVDLLLERMINTGFYRYPLKDLNHALTGLYYFSESLPDARCNLRNWSAWLRSFEIHVYGKSSEDIDWTSVIDSDAVATLHIFRQLDILPSAATVSALCHFAKCGFDSCLSVAVNDDKKAGVQRLIVLSNYAEALLRFDIDPDQHTSQSWRSWFECWQRHANFWLRRQARPPSLLSPLALVPQIAHQFHQHDMFRRSIRLWNSCLSKSLDNIPTGSADHLSNLFYNLCCYVSGDRFVESIATEIIGNIDRLQIVMLVHLPHQSYTSINRTLVGMLKLKRLASVIRMKDAVPSDEFRRSLNAKLRRDEPLTSDGKKSADLMQYLTSSRS